MIAADTSVLVAAFASWHERHESANGALGSRAWLIAICAVEAYSVLTRLPPPHRVPAGLVRDYLLARFPGDWLVLAGADLRKLLAGLPDLGISAGATYDAVVAATAVNVGATLLSLDRRAARTYEGCGADVKWLD